MGKRTTMGWNVDPSGFHAHLMRMHRDMGLPMIVTENGASWPDEVGDDGRIRDVDRYTYLHDHLGAVLEARSPRVRTSAATWRGASWTTSSGRTDTPSGSGF